jgi:hypothetical protein
MVQGKPGCPGESRDAEDVVMQPMCLDRGERDFQPAGCLLPLAAVIAAIIFTIRRCMSPVKTVILLAGLAVLGYVLKDTFIPLPAAPFNWDAIAAGITLAAGIVLPLAYPPLRRGIRESPLFKAGASALLGPPGSATDR